MCADLLEHFERAETRRFGEVVVHEQLADNHVHGVARGEEALAPAGGEVRDPEQVLVVADELVLEGEGEVRRVVVRRLPAHIAPDAVEPHCFDDPVELGQEFAVLDEEEPALLGADIRDANHREPALPVKRRHDPAQLLGGCAGAVCVAFFGVGRHRLRHRRLNLHDISGVRCRLSGSTPRERHDVDDHRRVRLPVPGHVGGGVDVVGAVGHCDASLGDEEGVDGGVLAVCVHPP
mmetsp:Transcript_11871/g.28801  ORF Transcript_11871/g.28801 Transcript_11871/m.28801 type:complete len:235 (+) Transcript_11871:1023-1727(+)